MTASGSRFSWGAGSNGQRASGGTADLPAPTAVESLTKEVVLHVDRGAPSIARRDARGPRVRVGRALLRPAHAAGDGGRRVLPPPTRASPHLLDGPPITQNACGAAHSAFLGSDGRLFTAGDDSYGQLGHAPPSDDDGADPAAWGEEVPLPAGARVRQVACGAYHTVLLVEAPEEPGAIRSVPLTPRVD